MKSALFTYNIINVDLSDTYIYSSFTDREGSLAVDSAAFKTGELLTNQSTVVDTTQYVYQDSTQLVAGDSVCSADIQKEYVEISPTFTREAGVLLPEKLMKSDGLFLLLLTCFLLLAYMYKGGVKYVKENTLLAVSASKSSKLEAQVTIREKLNFYFLIFLAILVCSICLYEGLDEILSLEYANTRPFVTVGAFVLLLTGFVNLKILLNKMIGSIFDYQDSMKSWNQSYLVLLGVFGVVCFIPTLILVYSDWGHDIIMLFCLILFLIAHLILIFRIIGFFKKHKFNYLFLIAYLCTVEILPYIYLGVGVVYLYKIDIFNTIL